VEKLAARSAERVKKSEDFEEIREMLKEAEDNDGVVRLEEILKEQEKADSESEADAPESEEDEDVISPQVQEATNILADLVAMQI